MAIRTTPGLVRQSVEVYPEVTEVDVFINRANAVTDVIAAAGSVGTAILREIETLLACHYYRLKYPQYLSKSTGGASGSQKDVDFWGEAKKLDPTGTLQSMDDGNKKSSFDWLGKTVSTKRDFWERN